MGYPGGQGGVPFPIPRRKSKSKPQAPKESTAPLREYKGRLESKTADKLMLISDDGQELQFNCTKETKYLRKGEEVGADTVSAGAQVAIDARQNNEAFLFAVNVRVEHDAPPPAERSASKPSSESDGPSQESAPESATEIVKLPNTPRDPDDPGPPTLQRGKPERLSHPEPEPESAGDAAAVTSTIAKTTDAAAPAAVPSGPPPPDQRIENARVIAANFTESLPNYIVQQMTTRYWSQTSKPDWKAQDLLSAEVIYLNGKELYRNIKLDNKPVKKSLDELGGSVSHGEFGTTLIDLMSPATAAHFSRRGLSHSSGRSAWRYDFSVNKPNSHWLTRFGSHSIRPAYTGSMWLDPETSRVLRIEMQARNLPEDYPLDTIEWVVEYGSVRIGSNEYILPVHAENLACVRGSSNCSRNATDFRNYRRFTAESQIYTTESTVDFGKEVPVPAKK